MTTQTPRSAAEQRRERERAAKFARAMTRNVFGRFYCDDQIQAGVRESLARRPNAVPKQPRPV